MLTITWSQAGYQLQSSIQPTSGWNTLVTQGNQHTEPITAADQRKFFRLIR